MSWQQHVDFSLCGSGHVERGCIFSKAGDSVWANSADLKPTNPEMKSIADLLAGNQAAKDTAFAKGLTFAGKQYVLAKVEGRSAYARSRKDEAGNGGKDGLAIAMSGQAIIVGHHGESKIAGNATQAVESLADYLVKAGY